MKPAAKLSIVLVTTPNLKSARQLVRAALTTKLIACANLLPKVESHFWWEGKIQTGKEVLLILKAPKTKLQLLEKLILAQHSYATPEILVLPVSLGNQKYLDWVAASCR